MERTLSIIKPDATERNLTGRINAMLEDAGLRIIAQKRVRLTLEQAAEFYHIHAERSFFSDLIAFMSSGPIVVQILEGENAIQTLPADHGSHQSRQRQRGHDSKTIRPKRRAQLGPRVR